MKERTRRVRTAAALPMNAHIRKCAPKSEKRARCESGRFLFFRNRVMKIFNTLTRKKEDLIPLKDKTVAMYSCGPTVYNFAHIGNLRTYIFMDLLRRGLRYSGYKVKTAMNITDVGHLLSDADEGEDKMALAAREQKKSPFEIAAFYTDVFFADCARLNISKPEIIPKATEHIKEMIDYVITLEKKGVAYETDDGI